MDGPLLITMAQAAVLAGVGAVLAAIWRYDRRKLYALCWAGTYPLFGGGWVLLTALKSNDSVERFVEAAAGDAPFLAGFTLLTCGMALYVGRRPPLRPLTAVALAGYATGLTAIAFGQPLVREFASSGVYELLILPAMVMLARHRPRRISDTGMLIALTAIALNNALYAVLLLVERPDTAFNASFTGFTALMLATPLNTVALGLCGVFAVCQQLIAEANAAVHALHAAQKQLIESEKMASLGGLVAGVAHEINTPLGIALTSASHLADQTARMTLAADTGALRRTEFQHFMEVLSEGSALITRNLNRAAEIVERFREIAADRASGNRRRFDLKHYMDEVVDSLHPWWCDSGHRFEIACPEGIELDSHPGALAQVISNLVQNSLVHGFPAGHAGRMSLTARVAAPGMVELVYADDGRGIPPADHDKIFEPFFTTGRSAGCTGLGLHIAFNLVTGALGGHIALDATAERGARFTLHIPTVAPAQA